MVMGSAMVEMAGCVLAHCVNELVRRDGANLSSIEKMMKA
jgi:hypothetical protein